MVSGAEREEEIGGIVDIYQRKTGNKALLFDDIPGYPQRLSRGRQHPDLGHAHQHDARAAGRRRATSISSHFWRQLHEGNEDDPAGAR